MKFYVITVEDRCKKLLYLTEKDELSEHCSQAKIFHLKSDAKKFLVTDNRILPSSIDGDTIGLTLFDRDFDISSLKIHTLTPTEETPAFKQDILDSIEKLYNDGIVENVLSMCMRIITETEDLEREESPEERIEEDGVDSQDDEEDSDDYEDEDSDDYEDEDDDEEDSDEDEDEDDDGDSDDGEDCEDGVVSTGDDTVNEVVCGGDCSNCRFPKFSPSCRNYTGFANLNFPNIEVNKIGNE